VIKVTDLCFSYGDGFILQKVNLALCEGEIVALVGKNGSGKTTLLKLLLGLLKPCSGNILVGARDTQNTPVAELARTAGLAREPRLLILDEPTTGMDGYHLRLLKKMIARFRDSGVSILLAPHDAELILDVCERVLILEGGVLQELGSTDELLSFLGLQPE